MRNKPNQKPAITKAGSRVDTSAESDVEPPPVKPLTTSPDAELALPREEPILGSLLGSYTLVISKDEESIGVFNHTAILSRLTRYSSIRPAMVGGLSLYPTRTSRCLSQPHGYVFKDDLEGQRLFNKDLSVCALSHCVCNLDPGPPVRAPQYQVLEISFKCHD